LNQKRGHEITELSLQQITTGWKSSIIELSQLAASNKASPQTDKMAKTTEGEGTPDFSMFRMEDNESKTMRMFDKNPYLLFGLGGGLGGLAYMAKKFTQRGNMKPSVYFIHTRLLVQVTVIGSITAGMVFELYQRSSQYYRESHERTMAQLAAQGERSHAINWPKGGYESKPGPGIILHEFKARVPSSQELSDATINRE